MTTYQALSDRTWQQPGLPSPNHYSPNLAAHKLTTPTHGPPLVDLFLGHLLFAARKSQPARCKFQVPTLRQDVATPVSPIFTQGTSHSLLVYKLLPLKELICHVAIQISEDSLASKGRQEKRSLLFPETKCGLRPTRAQYGGFVSTQILTCTMIYKLRFCWVYPYHF